ncbi:outer membrane protein assembly factor BamA [Desulfosarcina alkanivorans]|uniref:Outer membrane protein assembly factor BamA n=1 Tax=Desulfosarcina alkanivorans TaxID=571177 RepID=A0A5K7YJ85_9BACT|nr:outer membrane protein assembly factor BamA [Desulfosarcina alkanivorans]BBO66484.1 outer membrane protein assembly factor BamA [Desulfosarcina alkanivorans]
MLRRYLAVLFFPLFLMPRSAAAVESVRVLVLPFEIHASQDLSYLKQDIPKAIIAHLEKEGAVSVAIDNGPLSALPAMTSDAEALKETGLNAGADNVIWGSMTRIGDNISLDISMVATVGATPAFSLYEAGTGMQNLRTITQKAAEKLARQLFRRELVTQVRVTGNKRIEADAIERVIRIKAGDVLRAGEVSKDMKNIYKMGYFEDIRVEAEAGEGGKAIVFHVKEKPTIRKISFTGNRVFDDEKLRENLSISTGSILNIFTVKSNIDQLQAMYKEKNYHNIKIDHIVHERDNNQADIEFSIEEGEKVKIKGIAFQGNTTFTDKKLKKTISTSEKGFFSWITSSGELNREDLNQDAARLMAYYQINGFIHAKVADPVVEFEDQWIYITFKIEEGERFKVGTIDMDGELILPKTSLMPRLKIAKEPFFNRETVRKDIVALTDLYADAGFAYADISPLTREHPETHLVDITYTITKRDKVYFGNIDISGNTRTRDKVIRRELRIHEQGVYSGSRLKRSVRNLHRLDFFEDVKVDTPKGSADDKMNVNVEVVEKPTGTFTFGAGYSTVDDVFMTGSISQRNLFGRGQILKLSGQVGGSSDLYNLSFTEPWMFDIPLSGTINIYRTQRDYDTYDKTSMGGAVGISYPIFDYTRASISYRYDNTDISEITEDASDNIRELEGTLATSAVTTGVNYDSRDRAFNTTQGQDHSISYSYAGIGGDIGFHKVVGQLGWYIPVYKGLVTFFHGESGYVREISGYTLPDYEKFYLGGLNSVRGFGFQDINIKGTNSDGEETEEGGEKYVQFNFELTYPLFKDLGIVGVVFYDTGNVFGPDDPIDFGNLRQAAGYGIRWYSPIGPIRIEGGHILDPEKDNGEDSGVNWEFSMGGAF